MNCLSGKSVPLFDHPYGKGIFPNAYPEPPLAQLCAVLSHSVIGHQREETIGEEGKILGKCFVIRHVAFV